MGSSLLKQGCLLLYHMGILASGGISLLKSEEYLLPSLYPPVCISGKVSVFFLLISINMLNHNTII